MSLLLGENLAEVQFRLNSEQFDHSNLFKDDNYMCSNQSKVSPHFMHLARNPF